MINKGGSGGTFKLRGRELYAAVEREKSYQASIT